MGYGVKLTVWGKYACFTRPEFGAERVSYDVITPSAARGIIEAIYRKPAIKWVIDSIQVNNEIRTTNILRNELGSKINKTKITRIINKKPDENQKVFSDIILFQGIEKDRQLRNSLILRDVSYTIEAHFEKTEKWDEGDTVEKHYNIAKRRIKNGQCYCQPYFGTREFPANFEWAEENPESFYKNVPTLDLSWMLYDIDYTGGRKKIGKDKENQETYFSIFFRAIMKNGIIDTRINK